MFKIIYGGFSQETNTFSPLICTRKNFEASHIYLGKDIPDKIHGTHNHFAGMLDVLLDAEDVQVIPTGIYKSGSYGYVDIAVADEFIELVIAAIRENAPIDGVFLTLHGGMCLTGEDDGIGYILNKLRKAAGPDVFFAASTDLHANITRQVMDNLDILTGYWEYPHVDLYNTGKRAADLGLQALRTGVKPVLAFTKIPMILQAEASMTTEGPLKELVDYAKSLIADGTILDYSLYHMQPWLDCKEAGASSVVIAKEEATARAVSLDLAKRFFALRKVLQYHPISVDEGLDLAVTRPTKELIVLSDAADNTSGGATGDSVVVLRRILERKLDIRAACVVADPEAVDQAIALGEGATAVFTIGGKLDPARQKPVTFEGTVQKICAPEVVPDSNSLHRLPVSFGKAAILRVRNVDVIVCVYPQLNYEPSQFLGFGLRLEDYDMVLVKSSLAYREHFRRYTTQMYNVDTPGSTTSNLVSLGFRRIPRPMFPFDDIPDDTPLTVYVSH